MGNRQITVVVLRSSIRLNTLAVALASLVFFAHPLFADLIGTQVTGYYGSASAYPDNNLFDPLSQPIPSNYLNSAGTTVTIDGTAIEFGEQSGVALITADFSGTQLTLTTTPLDPPVFSAVPVVYIFTGTGQFTSLTAVSDTFPGGLTAQLDGQAITIGWLGQTEFTQPLTATFAIGSSGGSGVDVVPEPGTGWLMITALLLVIAGMIRKSPNRKKPNYS